jgi:hypothetical protein
MTDIFREIDEEVRRERYMRLWERYGAYVVGAALLLVVAVGGWRAWEWYQAREAAQSGARFQHALQLSNNANNAEALAILNEMKDEAAAGYQVLARFRAAGELAEKDPQAAVAAFDAIAADSALAPALRDMARIHAGYILVDTASVAEIRERMKPLAVEAQPFRYSAQELIGLAHYRAGEYEAAGKIFSSLMGDPNVPPSMRQRMQVMNALVAGRDGSDAPAPAAATQ